MARGFLSVGVTVALVAVVALGRGGLVPHSQPPPRTPVAVPPPPSALPGLQATPGPWPAEYRHLAARMAALGLPDLSDTVFHVHAMLRVFVDGRPVVVPADIGLPGQGGVFSPLHTHDTSGIIHIESARPYAFSLGQFFDVWGVVFTATQLGSLHSAGARTLQVYVNGRPVADGPAYRMQVHDNIVVAFGRAGSFPTNPPADFSGGL